MPSRMEKYYEVKEGQPSRTRKNQELYNQIYDENNFQNNEYTAKDYTNIEGVAKTPTEGIVNIDKIREMINNREEKNKSKHIINSTTPDERIKEIEFEDDEPKNYDINDVLNKAKDERTDIKDENDFHSLKNVELDILKSLQLNKEKTEDNNDQNKEINAIDIKDNPEEISQLFNTITNTSMLNKLGDKELSLDLLGDLKSNGTTFIGTSDTIKNVLKEEENKEEQQQMDKSFYTSTLKLKKAFFDDDEKNDSNKYNKGFKIFIIISIIVALIIIGIIIFKLIK